MMLDNSWKAPLGVNTFFDSRVTRPTSEEATTEDRAIWAAWKKPHVGQAPARLRASFIFVFQLRVSQQ